MPIVPFDRWATDAQMVETPENDSFLLSYPEFLKHFARLSAITSHDFIVGAYLVYGWMPTIPRRIFPQDSESPVIRVLNRVKERPQVSEGDLETVRSAVNHSLVGASKLLHFVNTEDFTIWDKRVYKYINGTRPTPAQINSVPNYLLYLANCAEIAEDRRFEAVHEAINGKIGYEVSSFRAIEWVMFMRGG